LRAHPASPLTQFVLRCDLCASTEDMGYKADELALGKATGGNLGLGCGNPIELAQLREGEAVADLGCGAGFDCFLAAKAVGPSGHVFGIDMLPPMLEKARSAALQGGFSNVSFRLGEIEHVPLADASVDVVTSNCVINLSDEKGQVMREAYRLLRPGGRVAISDVVRTADLPDRLRTEAALAC